MKFYEKYDIKAITKDLQKKLKAQDWEVNTRIVTSLEMGNTINDYTAYGACRTNRNLKEVDICLSKDAVNESNFLETLIHEILHVTSDNISLTMDELLKYIKDETCNEKEEEHARLMYEQTNEVLAKCFYSLLPEDYLDDFLMQEGDANGNETKKAIRCKGCKNTLH